MSVGVMRPDDVGGISASWRIAAFSVAALAAAMFLLGAASSLSRPVTAVSNPSAATFDPVAAVEPLRHPVVEARPGILQVGDARYRGEFTADGFALTLRGKSSFEPESAFALETVRFGGSPVPSLDWRADANTVEKDIAPGVTERVTALDGKLEWDFVLASPPAGSGDLTIEARVDARGPPTRTGTEWSWPAGKGRSVTMGELVVLDATGDELYRVLPGARAGRVLLNVPASVLAGARYPLTIDPVISAEYPASDPFVGVAPPETQRDSAVGFDGVNFLVVWTDWRTSAQADVFAARVSPTGVVLDPAGIPISTAVDDQQRPQVAFDATNFLVVWTDTREGDHDIYGARVSPAGTVLDPSGIEISTALDRQWNPQVASDGTNFLVVWEDWRSGDEPDIYGTRVNPAGTVLNPSGIAISTAVDFQLVPAVAASATGFLVAWEDWRNWGTGGQGIQVFGTAVSSTGVVANPTGIKFSGTDFATDPAIAFNGTNHLVTWSAADEAFDGGTRGARVNPGGSVLDPTGITISIAGLDQSFSSVASNGTDFFVVWDDFRSGDGWDVYGTGVTAGGTVSPTGGVLLTGTNPVESESAISFGAGGYLLTSTWGDFDSDIRAARVTQAGGIAVAPFLASQGITNQEDASVAFDGTNYLVVWQELRPGGYDIFAARVTPGGTKLDGTGFAVSAAPNDQRHPNVTFDGTNYLVVWDDSEDIYGARVSPSGLVLDPAGIAISTAAEIQSDPSVAFDGTNAFVVWADTRLDGNSSDIYGSRVTPAGTVIEPAGIPITTADGDQTAPRLASSGTNVLATWSNEETGNVIGARLSPAGTVLDAAGISISAAADWQRSPSVAFDGTNYLVVWEDFRSDDTWDVYGARVTVAAGSVLEPAGIPISKDVFADEHAPSVAFDGTNHVVAWTDERTGHELRDIYAARVSTAGTVHDPLGFGVATSASQETAPVAVRGASGTVGVVYDRFATESPFGGLDRAVVRVLGTLPGIPVTPSIDSGPSGLVNSTSATFAFSGGGEGVVAFECSRDGAAFVPCASPTSYTSLSQGAHTFEVRAKDAQNVSPVALREWTVDSVAPPTPTFESAPSGPTSSTSASFSFTDTEVVAFECNLDSGAFAPCTSPVSHADLSQGSHTFRVQAKDAAGNTSSSLTRTWTVDTVAPPVPTFTGGPTGLVNVSAATFTYTSESGATFECRRDDLAFAACNSTKTYGLVEQGPHSFEVHAKDAAGNSSTDAIRSWTVDTVKPPLPTVESGPNNVVLASTTATFTFSNTEPGVRFECSLDHAGTTICTSPVTYTGLSQGPHSWFVRARDPALNVTFNVVRDWTVDTVPPSLPTIDSGPSGTVASTFASFTYSNTEPGATLECKLDNGSFSTCPIASSFPSLAQGAHTFFVRARDAVGNVSAEVTREWTVDTLPPPVPVFGAAPAGTVTSTSASFTFSDGEPGVTFECSFDSGTFSVCVSPMTFASLAQGAHNFQVRAKDALGNTSSAAIRAWMVDTLAPQTKLGTKPKAKTTARTAKFAFSSEKGATFECKLDSKAWKACKSPVTYKKLKPGKHAFQVRSKDLAGNVDKSPAKFSWRVT